MSAHSEKSSHEKKLQDLGIDSSTVILASLQMDESPIIKTVTVEAVYDEDGLLQHFELIGFCGDKKKDGKHECFGVHKVICKTYEEVIAAFEEKAMCLAVSVVMCTPLHPGLPSFPLCLLPTCNCFTKEDMKKMWVELEEYFRETVGVVFNYANPLGVGSDGCSTRVHLQLEQMVISQKKIVGGRKGSEIVRMERDDMYEFKGSPCIGLCGTLKDGLPYRLHAQDALHCLKKMMNCYQDDFLNQI